MIYHLVRPIARFILRYYYRNIDLTGLEHIPKDAAVILAANHPTAFIEPCIMACFQPRQLWFLARGDLFKSALSRWALAAVNILPVFRIEDGGYQKLKDNFETFDACYTALSKRKAIMILAEGRCIHEKALRPLRKGTARLALGAMAYDSTLPEVYIVPVGVNFTHAAGVRGTVMIRCGEPIKASGFMGEYRVNEATAIRSLTSHLRARLDPLVVQFPSRKLAGIGEAALELDRLKNNTSRHYGTTHLGKQLDRELKLAQATSTDQMVVEQYARFVQNGLGAAAGANKGGKQSDLLVWLKATLALLLQLPHLLLWIIAEFIGASQPKTVEFYSSVRFAAIAGGTVVLVPLGLLLLPWPLKIWLIAALVTVRWSIRQWENLQRWWAARRWRQLVPAERKILEGILAEDSE